MCVVAAQFTFGRFTRFPAASSTRSTTAGSRVSGDSAESPGTRAYQEPHRCCWRYPAVSRVKARERGLSITGDKSAERVGTGAVHGLRDHRDMSNHELILEPEMLLKCTRCGRWHEVYFDRENAGATDHAREMLYWKCGTARYYAGQAGSRSRHPIRPQSVAVDVTRDGGESLRLRRDR